MFKPFVFKILLFISILLILFSYKETFANDCPGYSASYYEQTNTVVLDVNDLVIDTNQKVNLFYDSKDNSYWGTRLSFDFKSVTGIAFGLNKEGWLFVYNAKNGDYGNPLMSSYLGKEVFNNPVDRSIKTTTYKNKGVFESMFCDGGQCNSYQDWINGVQAWLYRISIPLAVLMISTAGAIWITSSGDPSKIALAKKIIISTLSGLGILLLASILTKIIGIT